MVKIIDNTVGNALPLLKIGDFVHWIQGEYTYLCVIAQIGNEVGQFICIDESQANRMAESKFNIMANGGTYHKLSAITLNEITQNGQITLKKVDVTIEITTPL